MHEQEPVGDSGHGVRVGGGVVGRKSRQADGFDFAVIGIAMREGWTDFMDHRAPRGVGLTHPHGAPLIYVVHHRSL